MLLRCMVLRVEQKSHGDASQRAAGGRRAYLARTRRLAPTWPDWPRGTAEDRL